MKLSHKDISKDTPVSCLTESVISSLDKTPLCFLNNLESINPTGANEDKLSK